MIKVTQLLLKYFFLFFSFLLLFSCSGAEESSSLASPSSSAEGPSGQSDGVLDDGYFYVGLDSELNPISHVHRTSLTVNDDSAAFAQSCGIISSATTGTSATDISCTIDIPEAELFVNGLDLKHHVPPGMCRFLTRTPYWFYNKEVGVGPASVVINKTYNLSGDLTTFSCVVDGVASPTCSGYSEVTITVDKGSDTLKCVYDTTGSTNGANCCVGDYTVVTNKTLGTGATTVDTKTANWGTNLGACINPNTTANWPFMDTKSGLPDVVVEKAKNGVDGNYKLTAAIDLLDGHSNIGIANAFASSHYHTSFVPQSFPYSSDSSYPYFIEPLDDRNGSPIPSAGKTYVYECRDHSYEILHRISVYVREWDTYQDYFTYIESKGATVSPDRGLTPQEDTGGCSGIEGPCDDFYDNDDFLSFLNLPWRPVDVRYTTAPAIGNRALYFPNLQNKK